MLRKGCWTIGRQLILRYCSVLVDTRIPLDFMVVDFGQLLSSSALFYGKPAPRNFRHRVRLKRRQWHHWSPTLSLPTEISRSDSTGSLAAFSGNFCYLGISDRVAEIENIPETMATHRDVLGQDQNPKIGRMRKRKFLFLTPRV